MNRYLQEEGLSQKSTEASLNRKSSFSNVPEFVVGRRDSSDMRMTVQVSTGLGASETSVPRLPAISPRLVRRLPPLLEPSGNFRNENTIQYDNLGYESEAAIAIRKLSNSDGEDGRNYSKYVSSLQLSVFFYRYDTA